jgi:lipoate-protein ligase A
MNYLNLKTTDPAFNLAVEEYVFDYLPKDRMYVMLWQNDNAIIIGKNQNTLAEINEAYVKEQGIRVVRRLSGGGAVYHDMGNLNFTVIADAQGENLDFGRFCALVVKTLQRLGVKAEINGRNDMTIDGKKFSGNAQYLRQGRVMHHGTILFDSNASVLANALQVDEAKIQAKGVKSVRSRVTNVRPCLPVDMTLPQFRQVLLDTILEDEPGEEYILTDKDLEVVEKLKKDRYDTWEWNYGHSPECTLHKKARVEGCGTVEAFITLREGKISQIVFKGDFFGVSDPEQLANLLIGCRPDRASLEERLSQTEVSRYFMGLTAPQLLDILGGNANG